MGSNEPQGEPRAHDTDHVRDLHCSPILRRHPGCALALRLWPYHWCRRGLGDGVSHTVPIYEGYSMPHAIQRINLAGRDLTDYICKILQESKIVLTTTAERESAKKIKEDLCYVSMDFAGEVDSFAGKEKQFEMPDGQVVTVHNQMVRCPELMFKPSLDGKEMMGLHELTKKTVNDCDLDVRKDLLGNVVFWRHHHVPQHARASPGRDPGSRPRGHQGQGHCSSRAHDLCLDWWLHPRVPVHLQPHVDQQGVQP